jgi:hypothetical protein
MTIKITQLGNLTSVYGNTIVPVVANIAGTLTTVKGNLTQIRDFVTKSTSATYGNIIPDSDITYNLGSATNRWKDLYLSGSTIFIGNANLSVSNNSIQSSLPLTASSVNTGNLNVTGEVTTTNIAVTGTVTATDLTTTGTVTTANIEVSGTVTATTLNVSGPQIDFAQGSYIDETEVVGMPGTYGLALNSPEDGIVGMNALDDNAAVTSSMIVSNVSAQINVANVTYGGNVLVWFYDQSGSIQWPDETTQSTAFSDAYIATIADLDANAAMTSDVIAANLGMKGYVDNSVTTANVGMKGYVDNQTYSNVKVSQYLPTYSGNIGVLSLSPNLVSVFSTVAVGFPSPITFANVIISGTNDVNGYSQLNVQNTNTFGNLVSADFIATAPNGTDSTHYIDMGINGNNYSQASWTISGANDGYVYVNGGNITLGTDTADTTVSVHVGGTLAENIVTTFADTGVSIHGNLFVSNTYVPALANGAGTTGQITYDNSYVYVCIATDTWRRANLVAW